MVIIQFVVLLTMILAQTYHLSSFGDALVEKSTLVGDMTYNSEWYLCDQTEKKMIQFIIMRSQKPSFITVYRFAVAGRQIFTQVWYFNGHSVVTKIFFYRS